MTESIDNLLNKLEEICEYYAAHNKPGDAMDIRTAVSEYHKEVAESANDDICESCRHYMCNGFEYPCSECCNVNDMDFYEYRDNWDVDGKYKRWGK